jgi:hypothetical protein
MNKPTKEQVDAEIRALEACKSYVPKLTRFNENNHEQLNLQVEELRDGIDDTADEWNDLSERDQEAIMQARDWKNGDEKESPSSGWDHFKPKTKTS